MARIGIDLDGVLYKLDVALKDYVVRHHAWPSEWCTAPTRWEFYEDWGLSLEGFNRLCNNAADAGQLWNQGEPIGGYTTIAALQRLKGAGHSVHVITHRSFGTHRAVSHVATAQWLLKWSIPYDTLTFSGDKTIVQTDWMIEDNVDNYQALMASGCRAVLYNRPWNAHLGGAVRVKNFTEFADKIMGGTGDESRG